MKKTVENNKVKKMTSEMWNNLSQEDKDYYNNLMYTWFAKESMLEMKQTIEGINKYLGLNKASTDSLIRFVLILGVALGIGIGVCLAHIF